MSVHSKKKYAVQIQYHVWRFLKWIYFPSFFLSFSFHVIKRMCTGVSVNCKTIRHIVRHYKTLFCTLKILTNKCLTVYCYGCLFFKTSLYKKMSYNSLLWLSSLHLVHILLLSLKFLTLVHIIKYDWKSVL